MNGQDEDGAEATDVEFVMGCQVKIRQIVIGIVETLGEGVEITDPFQVLHGFDPFMEFVEGEVVAHALHQRLPGLTQFLAERPAGNRQPIRLGVINLQGTIGTRPPVSPRWVIAADSTTRKHLVLRQR